MFDLKEELRSGIQSKSFLLEVPERIERQQNVIVGGQQSFLSELPEK